MLSEAIYYDLLLSQKLLFTLCFVLIGDFLSVVTKIGIGFFRFQIFYSLYSSEIHVTYKVK